MVSGVFDLDQSRLLSAGIKPLPVYYSDVIMGPMASQITSLTIV